MLKQILFLISLLITLGVFSFTAYRYVFRFRLTRPFPVRQFGKRFLMMMEVAIFQSKIFRRPLTGFFHALVFWGFCLIGIGSIEMVVDGLTGSERCLSCLGWFYDFITASGDVFALLVLISICIFLFRRLFLSVKRFKGQEMKKNSKADAILALVLIFLLMKSLLGMNMAYLGLHPDDYYGTFPVSSLLLEHFQIFRLVDFHIAHEIFWWSHILLIFLFANILPYSKHFHVFMSVPNVFLSRLEPLGKLYNMESVSREVKHMLFPDTTDAASLTEPPSRFGVRDAEDVTWKSYMDALSCTECGRCTSVCPANITGKKLSPRKIIMDLRARMKEKGEFLWKIRRSLKEGQIPDDGKTLLRDFVSEEELWACTTCNACAQECPININHPSLIIDMRRYLVMEEAKAPSGLNAVFANTENNGAPWQFSFEDRLQWTEGKVEVPVMAELAAQGKAVDYLFWVGCAGAFDDRYKKVVQAFAKVLNHLGISYAVLGTEETCTGDPARRAGNEMLFQMQAFQVIDTLKRYAVKRIITTCPHCYNIFRNEYPDLGGNYEVIHHTQLIAEWMDLGMLKGINCLDKSKGVTFHDPCYLGRANGEYDAPRRVLKGLGVNKIEMPRSGSHALCCGAGGGQMFKEAEAGNREIYMERTEEALDTGASVVATACPFCMTMLTDGIKYKDRQESMKNLDLAEMVAMGMGL